MDWTVVSVTIVGAVATVIAAVVSPTVTLHIERMRLKESRQGERNARRLEALYRFQEAFQSVEVAAFTVSRLGHARPQGAEALDPDAAYSDAQARLGQATGPARLMSARVVDPALNAALDEWTSAYATMVADLDPSDWVSEDDKTRAEGMIRALVPLTEAGTKVRERVFELMPELGA